MKELKFIFREEEDGMEEHMERFIHYMESERNVSYNTKISYERDLKKTFSYFEQSGISRIEEITGTDLNSYILALETKGFSTATISRNIASLKKFFDYMVKQRKIKEDPTKILKAPKVERKAPNILSQEEVELLLQRPKIDTAKSLRDKAMVELLYETGMRSSEMISLKVSNLNLELGYIICENERQERVIPFGKRVKEAVNLYLERGRSSLLKEENDILFVNRNGNQMTRQGFWKIMKQYAKQMGIQREITPYMVRHSFAIHFLQKGGDLQKMKERLGHSDSYITEQYIKSFMYGKF